MVKSVTGDAIQVEQKPKQEIQCFPQNWKAGVGGENFDVAIIVWEHCRMDRMEEWWVSAPDSVLERVFVFRLPLYTHTL